MSNQSVIDEEVSACLSRTPPQVELFNKYLSYRGVLDDIKASCNKMVAEDIPNRLRRQDLQYVNDEGHLVKIHFEAEPIASRKENPSGKGSVPIFPEEMRKSKGDYNVTISGYAVFNYYDPHTNRLIKTVRLSKEKKTLFTFPCMLRSDYCNLVTEKLDEAQLAAVGEKPSDLGGYFINGGEEKFVFMVDRLRFHQNLVLPPAKAKTAAEAADASLITTTRRPAAAKKRKGPVRTKITYREKIYCKQTILMETGTVQMKITLGAPNDLRCETAELGEAVVGKKIFNSINVLDLMELMIRYHAADIRKFADVNPLCFELVSQFSSSSIRTKIANTFLFMLVNLVPGAMKSHVVINFTDTKAVYEASDIRSVIKDMITWRKVTIPEKATTEEKRTIYQRTISTFITNFIFPNLPTENIDDKLWSLAIMCVRLIRVDAGFDSLSSRNFWTNKRLLTPGENLSAIFKKVWSGVITNIRESLQKTITPSNFMAMATTKMKDIATTMHKYMKNKPPQGGHGGSSKAPLTTEALHDTNPVAVLKQLTKITSPINKNSKSLDVRAVYGDGRGRVCPATVTDDRNCGFVKSKSIGAYITRYEDISLQIRFLFERGIFKKWDARVGEERPPGYDLPVMINGYFVGWCAHDARNDLVELRRQGYINANTSITKSQFDMLELYSDAGRIVRPVLVMTPRIVHEDGTVSNPEVKLFRDHPDWQDMNMADIVDQGYIEMLDAYEEDSPDVVVAEDFEAIELDALRTRQLEQLLERTDDEEQRAHIIHRLNNKIKHPFTHCDIHPVALLSVAAVTAPYSGFNLSCRVSFYTKMISQAPVISVNPASHKAGYFSTSAAHPIVEPGLNKTVGLRDIPAGRNCFIAFAAMFGNQEDNVVASSRLLEYGGFRYNVHHHFKVSVRNVASSNQRQTLARPSADSVHRINGRDPLHALTRDGLPAIGAEIEPGDFVIGVTQSPSSGNITKAEDHSLSVRAGFKERGYVYDVSVRPMGDRIEVSVLVIESRKLGIGDKITSHYAQKATVGEIRRYEDMPYFVMAAATGRKLKDRNGKILYDKNGQPLVERKMVEVVPDLIINPHSIAGRMTNGFLHELLAASAALPTGETVDATPLEKFDPQKFIRILNQRGFSRVVGGTGGKLESSVRIIDGRTGETIEGDVYVGPAHYFQLPHVAELKAYGRGWNAGINIDPFTKQPNKGRSKGGGLRFGNMEIAALMSNMAPSVARDILMIQSDKIEVVVCRSCARMADYNMAHQVYACKKCPSDLGFGILTIPYSFKLIQELLDTVGTRFNLELETHDELLERLQLQAERYRNRRRAIAR